jgi:hypothetical protein
MDTKEYLIQCVKKWVKIDNEIRHLKKEQNSRSQEKKKVSNDLIEIMRQHDIDCFDLKDGQIMYCKKNVKKPINQKTLMSILSNYFEGDSLKAQDLNQYIMENREERVEEKIVRKINKDNIYSTVENEK